MKSLRNFIEDDLEISLPNAECQCFMPSNSSNGLEELLTTCFVIPNRCRIDLPGICPGSCHKNIVDQCIIHLLQKKLFNNVLTFGYRIANCDQVSTSLHCVYSNSNASRIKSPEWQLLHKMMGTNKFLELLLNHTVIQYADSFFTQVVGNRANEPHLPPSWCSERSDLKENLNCKLPIRMKKLLYKKVSFLNKASVFPTGDNIDKLMEEIFGECLADRRRWKKTRFVSIMKKMIQNHASIKYSQILDNVCPKKRTSLGTHLDANTHVALVNKFAIIILEKLIPAAMFGSKRNKSKIFHYLSQLLRLPLNGSISFGQLMDSLKIEDFIWLKSQANRGKSNFVTLKSLIECFISWIFQCAIPRIITTFFYSTEVSSCVQILFFRHDVWNEISAPFLNDYFERHLIENKVCRNHDSYLLSKFNHNKLRLIPKKANGEFRVLTTPCKGADKEEYSIFKDNFISVIYPVQCILAYVRRKRKTYYEKLDSTTQIADRVNSFKEVLIQKYGKIPDLFFMKFDIASCYDSISRKKAMEVIKLSLENETGFFVRSQSFYKPSTGVLKIQNIVNGSRKPEDDEIFIDNVRTVYLSTQDILNVLKLELFETALSFGGKCYLRKDGLFQGSCLSALIVDLVYDDLMESLEVFKPQHSNECLVLRLADDFLVVSTDQKQILELKDLSSKGFEEYGAKINAKKIEIISNRFPQYKAFQFCALDISLHNLQVWKQADSFNIPNICFTSTVETYYKLNKLFGMRLSYGTTDGNLNTPSTILYQIYQIGVNVAQTFVWAFKKHPIFLQPFEDFISRILFSVIDACHHCPDDAVFRLQLRLAVLQSFLEVLLPNPSKFKNAIRCLKCALSKCTHNNFYRAGLDRLPQGTIKF